MILLQYNNILCIKAAESSTLLSHQFADWQVVKLFQIYVKQFTCQSAKHVKLA